MNIFRNFKIVMFLVLSIFFGGVVGGFFWVPVDIDKYSERMARLDGIKGVPMTRDEMCAFTECDLKREDGDSVPFDNPSLVLNSLRWRPWVVVPFAIISLVLVRPGVRVGVAGALLVSLVMVSFGLSMVGGWLVFSSLLYFSGKALLKKIFLKKHLH